MPRNIACFVQAEIPCNFAIGKRHLWTVCTKQIYLVGEVVLGKLDPDVWREVLRRLEKVCPFDFINLGEILVDSDLYRAANGQSFKYRTSFWSAPDNVRWRIELPEKFDDYIASLRQKTRQMTRQALRKSKDCRSLEVMTGKRQVDDFLSLAVPINQNSYQWNLGLRLRYDTVARSEYIRQAERGQFRCYVLRINGVPCAFIRGMLVRGIYLYQSCGFLPEYSKWSPGKTVLMLAIRDLLQTTDCKAFDFGDVGDHVGYKSRFGNAFAPSRKVLISKRFSVRPALIAISQETLLELKNIAKRVLASVHIRRRVQRFLRV